MLGAPMPIPMTEDLGSLHTARLDRSEVLRQLFPPRPLFSYSSITSAATKACVLLYRQTFHIPNHLATCVSPMPHDGLCLEWKGQGSATWDQHNPIRSSFCPITPHPHPQHAALHKRCCC